jgi:hypothetical protein
MYRYLLHFAFIAIYLVACKSKSSEVASVEQVEPTTVQVTSPSLTLKWSTDTLLKTPESILFDSKYGIYYVACIGAVPPDKKDNDGYIAKIDQQGKIISLNWAKGLSAPKGMGLKGDTLYVTDISDLVMINTVTGKTIKRIPIKGAQFLNDIDVDKEGTVYISDSNTNTVHKYDGKTISIFIQNEALGGPNGIYIDGDQLVMASFGKGEVYTISKSNPQVMIKTDSIPGGDGVEKYQDGFLVSNWNGEIYYVDKTWNKKRILNTIAEKRNAADIELVSSQNLVLVPEFFANKVTAYEIK